MSKAKVVLASLVWLIILSIGVLVYRLWLKPAEEARAIQHEKEVVEATSGNSTYKATIAVGLDGFSGYAILRSPELAGQLRTAGIKLETIDDGANYSQRLAALADGKLQMAAFPIDALLAASAGRRNSPATIVGIIDETQGADALLAYKQKFPNIDSLNSPETRFILVGGSPSETLFRLLLTQFRLDRVTPKSIVSVATGEEVLKRYRAAQPGGNEVFITWEPFVSQMKTNDQISVLIDSGRQRGYIVDALVVSRDYLLKNETVVQQFVEAYFRALYNINTNGQLLQLVQDDAKTLGTPLSEQQAKELVSGIHWKNTQENLAHFGLVNASVVHVENMLDRIKHVLVETKALPADASGIETRTLFTERTLRAMNDGGFHAGSSLEEIRAGAPLKPLSDEQWGQLSSVGTLSSPPLVFARSRAVLTEASQLVLDELADKLVSWPNYYVRVVGNSGSVGDVEANRQLASQRAAAALEYLLSKGIQKERIRAETGQSGGEMSVTFVFGQPAY